MPSIRGLLKGTPEAEGKYSLIQSHNEKDSQASEQIINLARSRRQWRIISLLLGVANLILVGFGFFRPHTLSDRDCARQLSVYSPAVEGIQYETVTLQNRFDEPSIYRGPPTQELENAWHDLYRFGLFAIPEDRIGLLNKTADKSANFASLDRMPENLGGGYRATVDVLHQLHCLNTIRQYTWLQMDRRHYGPGSIHNLSVPHALRSSEVGNRMHADHCIETIRKVLMCHADVTPLLDVVDPSTNIGRKADFNIYTKCRSFSHLQDWLRENTKIDFAEKIDDSA